jgi:hypothetical protein
MAATHIAARQYIVRRIRNPLGTRAGLFWTIYSTISMRLCRDAKFTFFNNRLRIERIAIAAPIYLDQARASRRDRRRAPLLNLG